MKAAEVVRRLMEVRRHKLMALGTERLDGGWLKRYCDSFQRLPVHLTSEQKYERFQPIVEANMRRAANGCKGNSAERRIPIRPFPSSVGAACS